MDGWRAALIAHLYGLPLLEATAVLAAIAYLVLAIRQSIWCWPCACISTAIYILLFIDAGLYMESALNLFYLCMAAYGWVLWTRGRRGSDRLPVTSWPRRRHGAAIIALCLLGGVNGWLLARYTDAAFPYADSMTTWAALWATWLLARKVLENWWYWLAIDAASVIIYWLRDLELTALLFVIYLLLIPFGIASWRRSITDPLPA
jgi:nicotinamide mononucleotide transporter